MRPPRPLGEVVLGERLAGRLLWSGRADELGIVLDSGVHVYIDKAHIPAVGSTGARCTCTVVEVVGQRPAAFDVEVVE